MSFAPVYSENSRALILGTWPSPKSREMAFYYGHPQNRFWPMMAALTGEPVPAREDIEAKKGIILMNICFVDQAPDNGISTGIRPVVLWNSCLVIL